jgi:hypothetical protein
MLRNIDGERQLNLGGICCVSGKTLEVIACGCVEVLRCSIKVDSHAPAIDVLEDGEAL